jgi:CRISPR-associated protein Csh1
LLKYSTGNTPVKDNQTCPLCGASGVTVFPNALAGADINISNVDRVGAFPGIDIAQAWKGYALCNACADLLYIYKSHFLKKDKNSRNPFITNIAGDNAIIIPSTTVDYNARGKILRRVNDLVRSSSSSTEEVEIDILDILKDEKAILNLTFLWATAGQEIDKVTGMITNVPPSRLTELSKVNEESDKWKHPLFPEIMFFSDKRINFRPDLSLRALRTLFYRPDASAKLQQLKKAIAASVYHKTEIPVARFWEEIMTTARVYWLNAIQKDKVYSSLLYEGKKKTGETFLTAAGWIRHLCWWIYYFKKLEVMSMEENFYEPQMEQLKPYFGPESGIDSPPKAYAFLLGALYGKVLQVQGAKGVNVGANALTWLKRLTLKGRDLPELYVKIREKLLAYETEKSEDVRDLIAEIGNLGWRLGDNIELGEISTNYYLLLGQSLTTTILPKKEGK